VIKTIQTDSTPLEEPKNPDTCNVFQLFKLVATPEQTADLRARYLAGNYGYGHAKQALFDVIVEKYAKERQLFNDYMANPDELDKILRKGADKARAIGSQTLAKVRQKVGF
jgi:tryptophanyl-tRNA synthetase